MTSPVTTRSVTSPLRLAIPSKGRLMEQADALFRAAGAPVIRTGPERGYQGGIEGFPGLAVSFQSAGEIARNLRDGKIDAGITGQDLLGELLDPGQTAIETAVLLGFGFADVVVAVPECWLDVASMADLEDVAPAFFRHHGARLRVATKYSALARRFFAAHGVGGYRLVDSHGATEGAPASGLADLIVDITTSGSTLRANRLKVLDDGIILRSQAVLAVLKGAAGDTRIAELVRALEIARSAQQ